jgi:membrane protease YdiL (CAAX protease family)
MSVQALAPILWSLVSVLWFVGGLYVYVALIRQISVRPPPLPAETTPVKTFGLPEAMVAAFLMSLLVINLVKGSPPQASDLNTKELIFNFILTALVLFILIAFLIFRGFNIDSLAGLSKVGILRVVAIGAILLFLAYPFMGLADRVMQQFLGYGSSRQSIVELFSGSSTIQQRILIIILAVAVAPVAEELVFRFFLYGVLRRYFGIAIALLVNSLLFAAVHQHLPSFGPLFVLGVCFTLAYEWSGSILVSMTMHSFFNSFNLVALAFPNLFQQ